MPEMPVALFVLHFGVGERGGTGRAPIDQARAPVDQSLAVEIDEDLDDGGGEFRVHRVALARPVGAEAKQAELLVDDAAVLFLPSASTLEELLTAQVVARLSLFGELPVEDGLRRDRGVVEARNPDSVVAQHT